MFARIESVEVAGSCHAFLYRVFRIVSKRQASEDLQYINRVLYAAEKAIGIVLKMENSTNGKRQVYGGFKLGLSLTRQNLDV